MKVKTLLVVMVNNNHLHKVKKVKMMVNYHHLHKVKKVKTSVIVVTVLSHVLVLILLLLDS